MFKRPLRPQLIASLIMMLLLPTACFRDTSEAIEQQPVARQLASPTAIEEAMPTVPSPTAPPPTSTEEPGPTEAEADQFALTATALIALQTQPAAGAQPVSGAAVQATAVPPARATIPPGADCVHEIRVGDTLFQLSLAYGVTVNDIARASGIDNPDRIAVGQHVTIPKCGTTGFIPPPTSVPPPTTNPASIPPTSAQAALDLAAADTRDTLVEQAQTSLLDNAQSNAVTELRIQAAALPTASNTYTVQQNDTLFGIAIQLGTTVDVLAALNGIADVDSLNAGQVLQTP